MNKHSAHTSPILTFFPRFIAWLIALQGVVYLIHNMPSFAVPIQLTITNAVGFIYHILGEQLVIEGNSLRHITSSHTLIVDNECTGLMLMASVFSALLSLNKSWQQKLLMLMLAFIVLACENILRISHLVFEVKKESSNFEFFHLYIWQLFNFLTALFLIWACDKLFTNNRAKEQLVANE